MRKPGIAQQSRNYILQGMPKKYAASADSIQHMA